FARKRKARTICTTHTPCDSCRWLATQTNPQLKHITVTLATWDAVWEVYLDPKWAEQRLRLYGAQDRTMEQFFKKLEEDMAEVSMERHGRAKQLVVFFGAATIGTGGGWGAGAVLRACCKVVCRPRGTDQRRGRVVLVNEHRTSRVSSAVNGQQPCERQLNKRRATRRAGWKPPAGQVEPRLLRPAWSQQRDQPVRGMMWCPVVAPRKPPQAPRSSQAATQAAASEPGPSTPPPAKRSKRTKAEPAAEPNKAKGKAVKAKPAPQPGRWLDRDCNAALNMQRIGESKWRPLELCYWPEQGKLPAKGKEYPGLGYKRLRDKPPKAQQQQPAVAHTSMPPSLLMLAMLSAIAARVAELAHVAELGMPRAPSRTLHDMKKQVIKVPGGAVLRGCKKTKRKLLAHFQLRAGVHSQLRVIAQQWLDRDCNAALNMQRIGESKWRPLELCWWPEQGKLPAKGKEYPGLGYKRLRDKPPKAQQQQPAVAHSSTSTSSSSPQAYLAPSSLMPEATLEVAGKVAKGSQWWSEQLNLPAKSREYPGLGYRRLHNHPPTAQQQPELSLNMQRIGESKWRPLELCWWPEQGKLPAKGKEYPGLGYKRLRDKPPKAQQQQPAVAQ
ncbi:hypothetical protein QJQ45_029412, partial [Haematococcus lacustris]